MWTIWLKYLVPAGVDADEVSSPALANPRKLKAQQAVTRYVRYDSSKKPVKGKQQVQHSDQQGSDAQQAVLHAARPARGANTIASALSRQKQRQTQSSAKCGVDSAAKSAGERPLLAQFLPLCS